MILGLLAFFTALALVGGLGTLAAAVFLPRLEPGRRAVLALVAAALFSTGTMLAQLLTLAGRS